MLALAAGAVCAARRACSTRRVRAGEPSGVGASLDELVIYELHVGTFTPEGTFDGVVARLAELRELGVTAIELMPVATFPGERGWGYDGVYIYAPHRGLRRARRARPPRRRRARARARRDPRRRLQPPRPRRRARRRVRPVLHRPATQTFWGDAIDYSPARRPRVGDPERRAVGPRLPRRRAAARRDARDLRRRRAARARGARRARPRGRPDALVIAEMEIGDLRADRGLGPRRAVGRRVPPRAARPAHRRARRLLRRLRQPSPASRALYSAPRERLVFCSQNHDQVGNRALGDRPRADELRAPCGRSAIRARRRRCSSWARSTASDGRSSSSPTTTTRRSPRRRAPDASASSARFAAFAGDDVPDPQDPETFVRSTLRPDLGDPSLTDLYTRLIALRRHPVTAVELDEESGIVRVRRGGCEALLNFSGSEQHGVAPLGVLLRAA